ncbi:MAG: VWA domain-containing protein [Clostridia bacterium]|nr:VWA domain-containing protein [Clostridia bacterium]
MKKTVKNNITELVFILDRSGSMYGLEADTVGGFNSMIEKQKTEEGRAYVSTVLFNDSCFVLHDRVELEKVEQMKTEDFQTSGCTALYDAIGHAIHHIANIHKYAREEDVPEKTVFVITTDGMENASREYSHSRVKAMIEKEKEKYGWEFLFIAANIDAGKTAALVGIDEDRAVNYCADSVGTQVLFDAMSEAVCQVRNRSPLDSSWSNKINEDYNNRG